MLKKYTITPFLSFINSGTLCEHTLLRPMKATIFKLCNEKRSLNVEYIATILISMTYYYSSD